MDLGLSLVIQLGELVFDIYHKFIVLTSQLRDSVEDFHSFYAKLLRDLAKYEAHIVAWQNEPSFSSFKSKPTAEKEFENFRRSLKSAVTKAIGLVAQVNGLVAQVDGKV